MRRSTLRRCLRGGFSAVTTVTHCLLSFCTHRRVCPLLSSSRFSLIFPLFSPYFRPKIPPFFLLLISAVRRQHLQRLRHFHRRYFFISHRFVLIQPSQAKPTANHLKIQFFSQFFSFFIPPFSPPSPPSSLYHHGIETDVFFLLGSLMVLLSFVFFIYQQFHQYRILNKELAILNNLNNLNPSSASLASSSSQQIVEKSHLNLANGGNNANLTSNKTNSANSLRLLANIE